MVTEALKALRQTCKALCLTETRADTESCHKGSYFSSTHQLMSFLSKISLADGDITQKSLIWKWSSWLERSNASWESRKRSFPLTLLSHSYPLQAGCLWDKPFLEISRYKNLIWFILISKEISWMKILLLRNYILPTRTLGNYIFGWIRNTPFTSHHHQYESDTKLT